MSKALIIVFFAAACGTPSRQNMCCSDEVECRLNDLPLDNLCGVGLVCVRDGECVPDPCVGTTCDALEPYCVDTDRCTDYCTRDRQCPGFGEPMTDRFCVDGTCEECRMYTEGDCPATRPFCDQGSCRTCQSDFECGSGICTEDGSCAPADMIAYVRENGSDSSDCTPMSPCRSVVRAALFHRPYVLVAPGSYDSDGPIVLNGQVLKGQYMMPTLRRITAGPVISVTGGHVIIENVEVFGAETGFNGELADGISCNGMGTTPTLELRRVEVRANRRNGLRAQACDVTVSESAFFYNGRGPIDDRLGSGVWIVGGSVTIDRSMLYGNAAGLDLDTGRFQVTNTFITNSFGRTNGYGVEVDSVDAGSRFEHNTVADNGTSSMTGGGVNCNVQNTTAAFPNNIIARNLVPTTSANCTFPSSIVDSDATAIKFKGLQFSMYDYHVTAGSIAIDAATTSSVAHDFDGDPRVPPADIGADEFGP